MGLTGVGVAGPLRMATVAMGAWGTDSFLDLLTSGEKWEKVRGCEGSVATGSSFLPAPARLWRPCRISESWGMAET